MVRACSTAAVEPSLSTTTFSTPSPASCSAVYGAVGHWVPVSSRQPCQTPDT